MADKLPNHQDIERYVHELPREVIARLPDCPERKYALERIDLAYDYAKLAREKAPRPTDEGE